MEAWCRAGSRSGGVGEEILTSRWFGGAVASGVVIRGWGEQFREERFRGGGARVKLLQALSALRCKTDQRGSSGPAKMKESDHD